MDKANRLGILWIRSLQRIPMLGEEKVSGVNPQRTSFSSQEDL
ncbi:hypothetical protein UF75_2943 [Desulfosporosinus sp. I2]|nr:hypothetical protein UF75_2943 [Desulfosporosinus sp. I2]